MEGEREEGKEKKEKKKKRRKEKKEEGSRREGKIVEGKEKKRKRKRRKKKKGKEGKIIKPGSGLGLGTKFIEYESDTKKQKRKENRVILTKNQNTYLGTYSEIWVLQSTHLTKILLEILIRRETNT